MGKSAPQPAGTDPSAVELIAARPMLSRHAMDGLLAEGVALAAIAQEYGTPTWVYGAGTIVTRYRTLHAAMPGVSIHYAVKANDHLAILAILAAEGAGADVVSGGEILRALKSGIAAKKIIFSGVGKTRAEITQALATGIAQLNVESAEELAQISAIATSLGKTANIVLRINPDIDAGTHDKIATGRAGDKFGIPLNDAAELYAHAANLPGLEPIGLALHIGSQIHSTAPFLAAYGKTASLVRGLRARGLPVETVDCGGGLGIAYRDEPAALPTAWYGAIRATLGDLGLKIAIEPGRWLVGPAGLLLTAVIRTKRAGQTRPIVVLDAAMNDLIRPAMYDSWHGILPIGATDLARAAEPADIVGPVCESSDIFARDRALAPLAEGALVAILDAGAYGAVMSSPYNARPRAAQVLVQAGTARLIRRRETVAENWAGELT